jgi:hypothetical protein
MKLHTPKLFRQIDSSTSMRWYFCCKALETKTMHGFSSGGTLTTQAGVSGMGVGRTEEKYSWARGYMIQFGLCPGVSSPFIHQISEFADDTTPRIPVARAGSKKKGFPGLAWHDRQSRQ